MSNIESNPTAEKKHIKMNIAVFVFIAIFIYLLINAFSYMTKQHVSYCEAEPGRIVDDDQFTGFILRDESVVSTPSSGYVNYYVNDCAKAAKNGSVCMINSSQQNSGQSEAPIYTISASDYSDIKEQITNFSKNYTDSHYTTVYSLDYQLGNIVNSIVSRTNIGSISQSGFSSDYMTIKAPSNGLISYTIDNMEGYTLEDISPDLFTSTYYDKQQLSAGTYVAAQSPVYKIVDDDQWQIVIFPTAEQLEKIADYTSIDITFVRDAITTSADVSLQQNGDQTYIVLNLSNYMVRYANDRYVDIEIIWNSHEGLKIPTSAVTTKDYYQIPLSYLVTVEDSSGEGFWINEPDNPSFVQPIIYARDDDYCYIDCTDISNATKIYNTALSEDNRDYMFIVGETKPLQGVYNINKGYAVFRLIDILYEYGDYCIISNDTSYGITQYDHIILDGSQTYDNQIIY